MGSLAAASKSSTTWTSGRSEAEVIYNIAVNQSRAQLPQISICEGIGWFDLYGRSNWRCPAINMNATDLAPTSESLNDRRPHSKPQNPS